MDQGRISFSDTMEIFMRNIKSIFHSCITSNAKKQNINDMIEKEVRSLALNDGLPVSFFSFLSPLPLHVMARINPERTRISGHIVIMLNSRYIRADKKDILTAVFDEYCHFLMGYSTPEIHQKLEALYSTGILPFDTKGRDESFCTVFGKYMINGTSDHPVVDKFVKNFIEITIRKMNDENWMYKISDEHGTIAV